MQNTTKKNQAEIVRAEISTRLKKARHDKGMSAAQVSRATGLSPGRISNWERGVKSPTFESAEIIGKLLDVSPNWLLCIDLSLETDNYTSLNKSYFESIPIFSIETKEYFKDISPIEHLPLTKNIVSLYEDIKNLFAIELIDDSMHESFKKNDVVAFSYSSSAQSEDLALIQLVSSKEILFRKLVIKDKTYTFIPLNSDWPKILLDDKSQFVVLGVLSNRMRIIL